jgi:hypothetical protein
VRYARSRRHRLKAVRRQVADAGMLRSVASHAGVHAAIGQREVRAAAAPFSGPLASALQSRSHTYLTAHALPPQVGGSMTGESVSSANACPSCDSYLTLTLTLALI